MKFSAVRAFTDQRRNVPHKFRIAQYGQIPPADIAGKSKVERALPFFFDGEMNTCGTKDMAGIEILTFHSFKNFKLRSVWNLHDQIKHRLYVVGGVQRLDCRKFFLRTLLVHEFNIFFLDVCAVHQHNAAEICGRRSAINSSGESSLRKVRKISGMIDMCMRKNNGVDGGRIERKIHVAVVGIRAASLKHAAIKQDLFSVDAKKMHRACNGAGGAEKLYFHRRVPQSDWLKRKHCGPAFIILNQCALIKNQFPALLRFHDCLFKKLSFALIESLEESDSSDDIRKWSRNSCFNDFFGRFFGPTFRKLLRCFSGRRISVLINGTGPGL